VLGLYSNIAIAWIMAVVADLVINKPLGLSPPGIEFKRAHLYDINPVGWAPWRWPPAVDRRAPGGFRPLAQAFSAVIAMVVALVSAPLIAWATGAATTSRAARSRVCQLRAVQRRRYRHGHRHLRCTVCERSYEAPDMAHCPAYGGHICSLCCTLDARCGDVCKPQAHLAVQWRSALRWLLPRPLWRCWTPAWATSCC
jgi:hypothetical protein